MNGVGNRGRASLSAFAIFLALAAVAAAYAWTVEGFGDYASLTCQRSPVCDDPAPAIDALVDRDLNRFFHAQPIMGPVSLALRAPLAGLARAAGAGVRGEYRIGAFACLLALAALGAALALLLRAHGRPIWMQVAAAVACVVNPLTSAALVSGHPEEALAAAFVVGAALFALSERAPATGVLLGLAIATKLWALLAVLPILALLPHRKAVRAGVIGVAVGALLVLPMAAGSPATFRDRVHAVNRFGAEPGTLSQMSTLWRFGTKKPYEVIVEDRGEFLLVRRAGWKLSDSAARWVHPAVLLLAAALALGWLRARRESFDRRATVFGVLALIFLLRAALDPSTQSYHHFPMLLALLCLETLGLARAPVVTVLAAAGLAWLRRDPASAGEAMFNTVYIAGAAALSAYLVFITYRSGSLGGRHGAESPEHRAPRLSQRAQGVRPG